MSPPFFAGVSTDKYFWQDSDAAYHTINAGPFLKGSYLLVDSFNNGWHTGWEITSESKEIAGYKCLKQPETIWVCISMGKKGDIQLLLGFVPNCRIHLVR